MSARITNQPSVTLLSHTTLPLETVFSIWEQSKVDGPFRSPEEVRRSVKPEEVRELFRAVIAQRIPVGEAVTFTFVVDNVSVSWREQAVRHRIGVSVSPERLGADIVVDPNLPRLEVRSIPDRDQSSFWSQSMRIQNMGDFSDRGRYRLPDSYVGKTDREGRSIVGRYQDLMDSIQDFYNDAVDAGVPIEDAREAIPLGAQHRITWTLNISALQHIVGERGCWILQLGLWGPVITGMISELSTKVDPIFSELVTPPCLRRQTAVVEYHNPKRGDREYTHSAAPEWGGCVYREENRRRYTGDDCHAPCPLYHTLEATVEQRLVVDSNESMIQAMGERAATYKRFWGRDPWSGRRYLPVVKSVCPCGAPSFEPASSPLCSECLGGQ